MATVDELREMPVFEALSDEQLQWLLERGRELVLPAGAALFPFGEPDAFYCLIEGRIELLMHIEGRDEVVLSADARGAWAGTIPMLDSQMDIGARVATESRLFRVPDELMREMLMSGFPIARHLLLGLATGSRDFQAVLGQQEKLAAPGRQAAGLAHELNNPAAAARRAAAQLGETLRDGQRAGLALVRAVAGTGTDDVLPGLEGDLVERRAAAGGLSPLDRSDREDGVGAWLDRHAIDDPWRAASALVEGGLDTGWLDQLESRLPEAALAPAVSWLVARLTGERLAAEIEHATGRISELVQAVKSYTYMDRGPMQDVDVHDGLEVTLTILRHKLRDGIEVVRRLEAEPSTVPGRGGELNQVWTNLIDNAIDAVGGRGRITVASRADDRHVIVEISDDGPGIPPEVQVHIFEPFFTTKPPGEGTGLGLDIVQRIIERGHGGRIELDSSPEGTTFRVLLPLSPVSTGP